MLRNASKVSDMWQENARGEHFEKWKHFEWWQALSPTKDIQSFWDDLQTRQIRINQDNDKIRWGLSQTSAFNMKEATAILTNSGTDNHDPKWKNIWKANLWPKISSFLQLLLRRCILTWENQQKRGSIGPSQCYLCKANEETIDHLLDECKFADKIWKEGERTFRNFARVKGHSDLTITNWPHQTYNSMLLNRIWELFP